MLVLTPISQREANAFVKQFHRNHKPVTGAICQVAISEGDKIRGVGIMGRPVSRMLQDGWTVEVLRCCTDGVKNGCSMLYAALWRAAQALGYRKLITYTLPEEGGASLKATGFKLIGLRGGGNWNVASRPRVDTVLQQQKFRWELEQPQPKTDKE